MSTAICWYRHVSDEFEEQAIGSELTSRVVRLSRRAGRQRGRFKGWRIDGSNERKRLSVAVENGSTVVYKI